MFIKRCVSILLSLGLILGLGLTSWGEEATASPAPTNVLTEKVRVSDIYWDDIGKRSPNYPEGMDVTNADFVKITFAIEQPKLINKIPFFVLEEGQTELEVPLTGARVYIASTAAFRAYENGIDVVPLEYSGDDTKEHVEIWVVFFTWDKEVCGWKFKLQHYSSQSLHLLTGPGPKQEMAVIMRYPDENWFYDTPFITYILGASPVD